MVGQRTVDRNDTERLACRGLFSRSDQPTNLMTSAHRLGGE
jgi:hypothetical protein